MRAFAHNNEMRARFFRYYDARNLTTVSNAANTEVTWSVSPSVGTISSTGLYIAPENVATPQTVTVRATSVADSSKSATATVSLLVLQPVLTSPSNGTTGLSLTTTLTWNVVTGASSYDVYFGSSSPPPLAATVANPSSPATTVLYTPALLAGSTTYYWRIVARNGSLSSSSATWSFSTAASAVALRFVPLAPCRVADTRNPSGPFGGPQIAGGATRSFTVPNSACGVPSTAQAYSLNVAVVPAGPLGYLTVWAAGQSQPVASTLNSLDGRVKSNAAIVPAGTGGAINVFASNATDLVLDINGYFVPATDAGGLAFYPITPCRAADTRNATASLGGPAAGRRQEPHVSDPRRLRMQYSGIRTGLRTQPGGDSERAARISDRLGGRSSPAHGVFTQRAHRRCHRQCRHRAGREQRRDQRLRQQ